MEHYTYRAREAFTGDRGKCMVDPNHMGGFNVRPPPTVFQHPTSQAFAPLWPVKTEDFSPPYLDRLAHKHAPLWPYSRL